MVRWQAASQLIERPKFKLLSFPPFVHSDISILTFLLLTFNCLPWKHDAYWFGFPKNSGNDYVYEVIKFTKELKMIKGLYNKIETFSIEKCVCL